MAVMKLVSRIWQLAGNIYLTMGIIGCMVADLVWGYGKLKVHQDMFIPINDRGFTAWAATWGSESLAITLWLFILVGLMALLSINTFVCTTDRVFTLVRFRYRFKSWWRFCLRLGPHVMHYAMLIMFLGYLVSYLFSGTHLGKILLPEKSIFVNGVKITLKQMDIKYYEGTRMPHLQGRVIDVKAAILFEDARGKSFQTIAHNRPAIFRGLSVHLRDFSPKYKGMGMGGPPRQYINVTVKQDPGMKFYFAGMGLFILGLFMYTGEKLFVTKPAAAAKRAVPVEEVQ